MSDLESVDSRVAAWLQPLADDAAPCGLDLETRNEFLELTQAAAGKPASQFAPAVPPDWRTTHRLAEELLDRSRDLRIAILWTRSCLRLLGFGALPAGLRLLTGLIEQHWDHVLPLPDADDGDDPYPRVNALSLLREYDGFMSDLRAARVVESRVAGILTLRGIEVAAALATARADEDLPTRDVVSKMLADAVAQAPALRTKANEAADLIQSLIVQMNSRLGASVAPDLKPIQAMLNAVRTLMPAEAAAASMDGAGDGEDAAEEGSSGGAPRSRRGLAGEVSSREEAIRAIDMVCAYLEAAEPTNPAPLFLRRGQQLIGHNFLQLMKVLAPDSLSEVARLVGVDPDTVEPPDGS